MRKNKKITKRIKRHGRVRAKILGVASRPRLSVFRSNSHIVAQLIDDEKKETILQANDLELKTKTKQKKTDVAFGVGERLAKKSLAKKISKIVFDRGGYLYHGRVKALAEGARKGGLQF